MKPGIGSERLRFETLEDRTANADGLPDEESRRRLIVRTGALLALCLTLFYTIFFVSQRLWAPVALNAAACIALAAFALLLNRTISNITIGLFLVFLITQLFFVTNLFLGKESGIHYFLFCIMPFLFIAFPHKQDLVFIVLFGILDLVAFIVTEYSSYNSLYLTQPSPAMLDLIHMGSTTGTILLISGLVLILYLDISTAKNALAREHDRSESLLLNILPAPIAVRLKSSPDVIAENFQEVSVLFADIAGFTALASRLHPSDLVEILNRHFSSYDDLAEKYRVEKIKTIGDAYMAAAGLPHQRDDHAVALMKMAIDMIAVTGKISREAGIDLTIRVGINSGEVTAGVIGKKKFIYDLWGDTVNIASRMESHGLPGRIQISEHTYHLLKEDFEFEHRGRLEIKGMGEQDVYLLKQ